MKFLRILRLGLRIILFVLLLILAINNMQNVEVNILGIYSLKLPLIIILAIFTSCGILLGILFSLMSNISLKNQLNKLRRQLDKQEEKLNKAEQII